jgi:glucose-6-phosphate isomerase
VACDIGLAEGIQALFSGDKVNTSEDRPALHTALRDFSGQGPFQEEINEVVDRMSGIVERIYNGSWQGAKGLAITDVVNIGIGGSHLGPMMVCDALQAYSQGKVHCHFVSNIDSSDILSVLSQLTPDTTLFVVSSKSFTTQETLKNAATAKAWLLESSIITETVSKHFIAVTANPENAGQFGITPDNILPMWDWVGGRYSLWSAIGISIALQIGMDNFNHLRKGAEELALHFREAPFLNNLPVLLALLEHWYVNYWGARSQAVLPYNHRLRYLPEFLQQLEMESNGKSVSRDNQVLDYHTSPVLWGTVETNGQHSFHQLLHQGTQAVPVDFIVALKPDSHGDEHHPYLFANCLAQANALMTGKSFDEIYQELTHSGHPRELLQQVAVQKQMPGNRPSNIILMETLTPKSLGALIALYEHKVYVLSLLWNINAFDQWGVELGKQISNEVYEKLTGDSDVRSFDSSTEALIRMYKKANKGEG